MLYVVYGLLIWTISGLVFAVFTDWLLGAKTTRIEVVYSCILGFGLVIVCIFEIAGMVVKKMKRSNWWNKPLLPTRSPRLVIQTRSGPFGKTVLSVLVCLPVAFCVWLCQIYSVDQGISALVGTVLGQITGFVIFLIWWKD